MLSVYAIVPLIIMVGATFYFTNKLTDSSWTIKLIYFGLEAISVIGFSYLFFLHGFIPSAFVVIIISVIIFIVLVTLYILTLHLFDNVYEQFSIVFNSLLFFIKVVLSFYLFMTIFRYQVIALQISLSLLLTGGLFSISYYLEKPIVRIINKTYRYLDNFDRYEFVLIPGLILLTMVFFFEGPNEQVAESLHLHNNVNYLAVNDDLPTDINVNFDQEKIEEYVIENRYRARDYFYTDDFVYLYLREQIEESYSGRLFVIDRDTGDILLETVTPRETFTEITAQSFWTYSGNELFFEHEGELFLFATDGMYIINGDTATKIAPYSLYESSYFFENDELYIIMRIDAFNYKVFEYSDQSFTETETINYTDEGILNLYIMNNHLMYYAGEDIYLREDPSVTMPFEFNTILFASDGDESFIHQSTHEYQNEHKLLYNITSDYFIKIYDENLEIYGYFKHSALHTWAYINRYDNVRDAKYRMNNDQLEYIVLSTRGDTTTVSLYELTYTETSATLPFYSHFSLGTFVLVILSTFIPFLNNEKFYTYIDYDSVLNKENEAE